MIIIIVFSSKNASSKNTSFCDYYKLYLYRNFNLMSQHRYFMLYKPYGFVSQFITNDKHAAKKKFLGSLFNFPENTMAVGRLDEPSEGLLLLTTNGAWSHYIRSKKIEKEYYVQVDGIIDGAAIKKLSDGVEITVNGKPYLTKKSIVTRLLQPPLLPKRAKKIRDERHGPTSWIRIIIYEGKFRQVRKMTSAVGFPTLRLVRYRVDAYTIDAMQAGEVKEITF